MRSRRVAVSALGVTMSPPPSCPKADKTRSMSAGLRTSAAVTDMPNEGAAASATWKNSTFGTISGTSTTATRRRSGCDLFEKANHFPPIAGSKL